MWGYNNFATFLFFHDYNICANIFFPHAEDILIINIEVNLNIHPSTMNTCSIVYIHFYVLFTYNKHGKLILHSNLYNVGLWSSHLNFKYIIK